MLVIAHRGFHASVPENTMAGFEAAITLGVNGIETDVRISHDGQPVLVHDRVIASGHAVADLTRDEIEQVLGHKVPTLDEALECFPGILWNIEIKTTQSLDLVIGILKRYQVGHRILITSFRHDVVSVCAASLQMECGLLVAHRPQTLDSLLANCEGSPRIDHIVWDYNVLDELLLKQATADGFRNFVYGPVTQSEHQHCRDAGIDGVITDHPLLAQIFS